MGSFAFSPGVAAPRSKDYPHLSTRNAITSGHLPVAAGRETLVAQAQSEGPQKRLTADQERALMAQVARLHYLDDVSRIEIAERLDISRFRVARLLQRAKETGLVAITINDAGVPDTDLSDRLQQALNLKECVVVRSGSSSMTMREQVGIAAAEVLSHTLQRGEILGISWGRTLTSTASHLSNLPRISVVQLAGSLSGDLGSSPVEVARQVSLRSGGAVYPIFSPLIVTHADTAKALRSQPDIAAAFGLFDSVTTAILAVGSWSSGETQLLDVLEPQEASRLRKAGAIGDVAGIIIDKEGRVVDPTFQARCIAVSDDQLRRVPRSLAVAAGSGKAAATIAAVRGGMVNGLVVDSDLANAILASV